LGVLEATADDIAARSNSPSVREAMIRFKSNAVLAMQGALLQPDPVAALIDAWALLVQMEQALPKWGAVTQPEQADIVQRSLGMLETEVEALWRELSGSEDVSQLHQLVHEWATKHPLTEPLVTRESTVPLLAAFTDRSGVGLLGTTAALATGAQDLVARMDVYAGSLPRQARWQAELAVQEMVEGTPVLTSAMDELGRAVDVLMRMGAVAGNAPAVVAREREALEDFISSERLAVMDGIRGERVAMLDGIRGERMAMMDQLHVERVETLAQTDTMGRRWVDHAFDRAEALVEHIFLWLLGLVLLFVLGMLVAAALLAPAWRRGEGLLVGHSRGGGGPARGQAPPVESHDTPEEHPGEPHH
jgi:hypothetical protein